MHEYGALTSVTNNNKEVFTSQTANGTSSVNTGGILTETLTCAWTDRTTYTPALGSASPASSSYLLTNIERAQLPNGLCQITLNYTATSTALPDTTYAEQSSQVEVDIREHPDFGDWADDWDDDASEFKPSSSKYGIKSYIKGTTTVTVTGYFTSKPSSDRANIGKIQNPGSDYSGSNKWLLIGCNRSKQGTLWVMQKVYLFSATDWNSDIYG